MSREMILIPKEKYDRLMEMNEKIQETNMKGNGQPENATGKEGFAN